MNYKKLSLSLLSALNVLNTLLAFSFSLPLLGEPIAPYYSVRSQGAYESRHLAGLYDLLRCEKDLCRPHGTFAITTDYMRSFNSPAIARSLFGQTRSGETEITVSGSRVLNRGTNDWLADYFYLPNDFKSTLTFSPIIDTFLVDFSFVMDLSEWAHGTYFYLHAPVTQTRFDIRMNEHVEQYGVNPQPAGIFTPAELNRGQLLENFSSYANGGLVQPVTQTVSDVPFFNVMQQLKNAQISPERKKDTGIADIRMAFGWNWTKPNYHLGVNLQAAAPGGNRPKGVYLFEPMIGNGHHWEMGGCLNAHYDLWTNCNETATLGLYADINLNHLFSTEQFRTFDLVNSSFSRYMLAQKIDTPITNNLLGNGITPTLQFKQEFTPIANLTNMRVGVAAALQADIVLTAHFAFHQCTFDIGYNFWYRSPDEIRTVGANELDGNRVWALKGDAQVFGFASEANNDPLSPLNAGQPVTLSATQSNATIYSGTNLPATGAADPIVYNMGRQNLGSDSPQPATAGGSLLPVPTPTTPLNTLQIDSPQINTSIQPRILSLKDVNLCGGKTRGLTNSIFAHFHYNGCELHGFTPSIGIGGQAEFAPSMINSQCKNGINTALNQWQLWLKVCFTFQ